jgi:hypothetical protein
MFDFDKSCWLIRGRGEVARVMCFAGDLRRLWVEADPIISALVLPGSVDAYVGSAFISSSSELEAKFGPAVGQKLQFDCKIVDGRGLLSLVKQSQSDTARSLARCWASACAVIAEHFDAQQKEAWKVSLTVMKQVCSQQGIVFGGAVRDLVLRRFRAQEFYSLTSEHRRYGDRSFHPEWSGETLDRLLLPKDIDACVRKNKLVPLLKAMRAEGIYERLVFQCKSKYVSESLGDKPFRLHRYLLEWGPCNWGNFLDKSTRCGRPKDIDDALGNACGNAFAGCCMLLDLLVFDDRCDAFLPISADMDFVCNALVVYDEVLAPQVMPGLGLDDMLSRILEQIKEKRAVVYSSSSIADSPGRIKKMLQKGWTLEHERASVLAGAWSAARSNCKACASPGASVKMTCCGAVLHAGCGLKGCRCAACRDFERAGVSGFLLAVSEAMRSRNVKGAEGESIDDEKFDAEESDDAYEVISAASCSFPRAP